MPTKHWPIVTNRWQYVHHLPQTNSKALQHAQGIICVLASWGEIQWCQITLFTFCSCDRINRPDKSALCCRSSGMRRLHNGFHRPLMQRCANEPPLPPISLSHPPSSKHPVPLISPLFIQVCEASVSIKEVQRMDDSLAPRRICPFPSKSSLRTYVALPFDFFLHRYCADPPIDSSCISCNGLICASAKW